MEWIYKCIIILTYTIQCCINKDSRIWLVQALGVKSIRWLQRLQQLCIDCPIICTTVKYIDYGYQATTLGMHSVLKIVPITGWSVENMNPDTISNRMLLDVSVAPE
jgi:hypothetical protein